MFCCIYNCQTPDSIAYSSAENTSISLSKTEAAAGETVEVTLRAPINVDYTKQEKGFVYVTIDEGETIRLELTEESEDSYYFKGIYTIPENANTIIFSYGIGMFEKAEALTVR